VAHPSARIEARHPRLNAGAARGKARLRGRPGLAASTPGKELRQRGGASVCQQFAEGSLLLARWDELVQRGR